MSIDMRYSRSGMSILTGDILNNIADELSDFKYMRKEVKEILEGKYKFPILLLGNRRFGKTTMLKMIAALSNDYDKVHIITLLREDFDRDYFYDYLTDNCRDSLVLVDEATYLENWEYKYLCDEFKLLYGILLVFTGTNSLSLFENTLYKSPGYGRASIIEIIELTPYDYKLMHGLDIRGWLDFGGYISKEENVNARHDLDINYSNYMKRNGSYKEDTFLTSMAILDYISSFNSMPKYNDMIKVITDYNYDSIVFNVTVRDILYNTPIMLEKINYIDDSKEYIPRSMLQLTSRFIDSKYYNPKFNRAGKMEMYNRRIFENYITLLSGNGWTSYWARIDGEFEIDCIDLKNGLLIEVKYSSKFRIDWLKHLRRSTEYLPDFSNFTKVVVYLGETFKTEDGIEVINTYDFMEKYHDPITIIPNPIYKGDD